MSISSPPFAEPASAGRPQRSGRVAPSVRPRSPPVHRLTPRYRMRELEELSGRDLSNSFDRMELWLALRARDLLAVGADG